MNTSCHFFSKLDSPIIKTLERIRFSSNQNIGEGESDFDEKNVQEVFNLCSTEQSCIHIEIACYKISTLIRDQNHKPLNFCLSFTLHKDLSEMKCTKVYSIFLLKKSSRNNFIFYLYFTWLSVSLNHSFLGRKKKLTVIFL